MFYCAHDPGLALLLARDEGWTPAEHAASPAGVTAIMLSVIALNALTLALIAAG